MIFRNIASLILRFLFVSTSAFFSFVSAKRRSNDSELQREIQGTSCAFYRASNTKEMVTNCRWPTVTRIINQLVETLLRILVLYYMQTAFTTSYIRSACPNKEITHIQLAKIFDTRSKNFIRESDFIF